MNIPTLPWWRRVEARLDAWAAKRLSPEEYAEAVELDKRLKANALKWLGYFVVAAAFFGLILLSLWPKLGPTRAFTLAAFGCLYVAVAGVSAWHGYRKYTKRPAWVVFVVFIVLVMGGAVTGFSVAQLNMGRSLSQIDPEKIARAIAIALLVGMALAGVLVGIAQMRLREATQRAARLQAEAQGERLARQGVQAELKLLQAQVEPHFLFNTLSNLRYMVQTGSRDALPMLDHLIHYLRTALPELRAEASTLGREAELARAYLEIMKLRMGGALEASIEVPAELANEPFPPLMLGTLVENAIKHGVAPVGRGRIAVRALRSPTGLRVEVEDDGRGLAAPIGQGVGLGNIRERLRALHGESGRLELRGGEHGGTLASIEVPR
ncbi:MAG TPA: histidine kinase [Usitatibacter sp.]|nr:histidine kinase [Usitatibacter sp.]